METLQFDRYRPPVYPVELMDEQRTVLHLTPPTVDLQEELRSRIGDLEELILCADDEIRRSLWDLAARLMSCNRNVRQITPEQLKAAYGLDEEDLVVFFEGYAAFLKGIENAKN